VLGFPVASKPQGLARHRQHRWLTLGLQAVRSLVRPRGVGCSGARATPGASAAHGSDVELRVACRGAQAFGLVSAAEFTPEFLGWCKGSVQAVRNSGRFPKNSMHLSSGSGGLSYMPVAWFHGCPPSSTRAGWIQGLSWLTCSVDLIVKAGSRFSPRSSSP
jgi:hypothetical protein